ncbi:MAG: UvrD-helicase domain-containing protein [Clostridia bacterium]|nr:UvrD-helicase domain-containing protein [Clostridia bacterium]
MSRNWTAAQLAAMNTKNKTLLVSAAAGSGKTATLTERIIRSITDEKNPGDLEKMLVVTFTRSAAEELKSRIFSALSQTLAKDPANRYLTSQLIKLGSARICTIDSFYLDLIRSNFSLLGLSASFRIADTAEMDILEQRVMEEVIDRFYETDENFPNFAECFTGTRSTDKLPEILISLAHRSASVPEGVGFFRIQAEETKRDAEAEVDFFSTSFGKIIREQSIDTVEHCYRIFCEACDTIETSPEQSAAMLPSFEYDRSFCLSLLDALRDPRDAYLRAQACLNSFSPIPRKRLKAEYVTEDSERFNQLRTDLIDKLRSLRKNYFSKTPDTIRRAMLDTARHTEKLYELLKIYDEQLREEKLRRNMMDFQDIRRYTLKLLVNSDGTPTETATQYAQQFTDIYIDEYQDVDLVQDLIFRSISQPTNRFMVGDIKQSIYSFRGAEPQVFSGYRTAFPDLGRSQAKQSDSATIFMSENFRCDKHIIEFTNLVCSRIFSVCTNSIGYQPQDDLVFSKLPPSPDYQSPPVEVSVLIAPKPERKKEGDDASTEEELPEKKTLEAEYIAQTISHLIATEKKADGSPILPGDIAVLFRSNSMGAYVAEALQKRGILTSQNDGDSYFESPDVLMVLCLLNAVDNPHRDIFLTGTLRSPIYGFSLEDLILIRRGSDSSHSLYDALLNYAEGEDELAQRCQAFRSSLESLRQSALTLPIDRFLRILFESEMFISSGLLNEGEHGKGGNLLRLYEFARTFESGSFKGLYNFIELVNNLIEEGKKMKLPSKGSTPDRVNLMSIHQSKGLEFPVCFLCGTASRFNRQDQQESLLFDYPTGIAMKIADSTGFARINTPMREALTANIGSKQTEEEMRVLYVALTRARERLYITASTTQSEEKLMAKAQAKADFCDRHTLLRCSSYLDWILLPFATAENSASCARLSFVSLEECQGESPTEAQHPGTDFTQPEVNTALYETLKEKYSFRYPYSDMKRIPAKLSVSRLSPDVLDTNDTSADLFPKEKKTKIPDFFITGKPSQASAADRGTATHLFLQFCDFRYAKVHGVKEELSRLLSKKFLPENIAELIYQSELEAFFRSELFDTILGARQIIREQRFNVLLSPDAFTEDPLFRKHLEKERLAVQGVIDLIVIDQEGKLCLFDYKTDRLTKEELSNPQLACQRMNEAHGLQLSYYAHAAELLFERPCDRLAVYSTHAGILFDIPPLPLIFSKNILDTL